VNDKIMQSTTMIELAEQLQMIRIVKDYLREFVEPAISIDPAWISGYALQNEIHVSTGDEPVYRCKIDAFWQDPISGRRQLKYIVSLVKFEGDPWRVFQLKQDS